MTSMAMAMAAYGYGYQNSFYSLRFIWSTQSCVLHLMETCSDLSSESDMGKMRTKITTNKINNK